MAGQRQHGSSKTGLNCGEGACSRLGANPIHLGAELARDGALTVDLSLADVHRSPAELPQAVVF